MRVNSNCNWDTFSLSSLKKSNEPIQCEFDDGDWGLEYTPCANQIACINKTSNENPMGMIIQYKLSNGECAAHTAEWDNGQTLPAEFTNYTTGEAYKYVFNYTNGWAQNGCSQEEYGGRKTILTFICDQDADPYIVVGCGEMESQRCTYYLDIKTKAACVNADLSHSNNSLISGGSIFLIIFFISLCLYCCCGYIYNGYKNNGMNDIQGNIPNSDFWFTAPLYIKAGCEVTFEAIGGLCCEHSTNRDDLLPIKESE